MIESIYKRSIPWLTQVGPEGDVVLYSRAGLSRNLADFPFPSRCSVDEKKRVEQRVLNALAEKNGFPKDGYYSFSRLTSLEQHVLVERDLAPEPLIHMEGARGVVISADQSISVVINGVDHIRIQSITPGLQPQAVWDTVNKLDDALSTCLDYAYRDSLGFLTSSLWLIGTGLRLETVLHLPALAFEKSILTLEHEVRSKRHVLDGLFGNIRNAPGDFYRLTNGVTLGKSEDELVLDISKVTREIIFQERSARERLLEDARLSLEDRVWRAVGLAREARLLDFNEAVGLISSIRLGISLGLIDSVTLEQCNRLLVPIKSNHLDMEAGRILDELIKNKKRADLFRAQFSI